MKKILKHTAIALMAIVFSCQPQAKQENTSNQKSFSKERAKKMLDFAAVQYKGMMQNLPQNKLPRTINKKDNSLITSGSGWWTSGFYPGACWYLYEYTNDEIFKTEAIKRTALVEKEKHNTGTHDLGFMLYCSFGNGYRLTGEKNYKEIMLKGAESLSTRFRETTACIQSWGTNERWQCPVIIDNMMNLEFLFWASRISGDPSFFEIAVKHANTTIKNHFRDDFSTWHVLDYDTITGEVLQRNTAQGYNDESAWARGQAWGLYGYVMTYRETKDEKYLEQAKKIADFIINHPNLPDDKVPYWDFNSPDIPDTYRDVSSASIISSALLELSRYTKDENRNNYFQTAEKMLESLSSDKYLAEKGKNQYFILKHSVGSIPHKSEIDVPLTYADYYYIEALMRYLKLKE